MISWQTLRELPNECAWAIKQRWRASRVPHLPRGEDDLGRVGLLSPEQRARYDVLAQRYALTRLGDYLRPEQWRENLYVLDVLDQQLGRNRAAAPGPGLDIGCRNFSYLPALHAYSARPWQGVELDAYARYWNGSTRAAYGRALAARYPGCAYHATSVTAVTGSYVLIVWFLPFLNVETLVAYGLPRRYFDPPTLLSAAHRLLTPGGTLLIVNQGAQERDAQQQLCAELALPCTESRMITSLFSPFRVARYATLLHKPHPTAPSL